MKLIEFLSTHSVNYAFTSGILLTILIVAIACIIILYLRLKDAKTWIKFSEIEKKQSRSELKEEKSFCETQGSMYSKLLIRHAELKQGFEDAVAEITELRNKATNLSDDILIAKRQYKYQKKLNELLIDNLRYWKERSLHQKHTKKVVVKSEWYECKKSIGEYFLEGKQYKSSNIDPRFLYLIGETGLNHIVNPNHFKPVTK